MRSQHTPQDEHASLERALKDDIRRWSAERDEFLARTGGIVTAQSERASGYVEEARIALKRLREARAALETLDPRGEER